MTIPAGRSAGFSLRNWFAGADITTRTDRAVLVTEAAAGNQSCTKSGGSTRASGRSTRGLGTRRVRPGRSAPPPPRPGSWRGRRRGRRRELARPRPRWPSATSSSMPCGPKELGLRAICGRRTDGGELVDRDLAGDVLLAGLVPRVAAAPVGRVGAEPVASTAARPGRPLSDWRSRRPRLDPRRASRVRRPATPRARSCNGMRAPGAASAPARHSVDDRPALERNERLPVVDPTEPHLRPALAACARRGATAGCPAARWPARSPCGRSRRTSGAVG